MVRAIKLRFRVCFPAFAAEGCALLTIEGWALLVVKVGVIQSGKSLLSVVLKGSLPARP